jgi:hypothetical protein
MMTKNKCLRCGYEWNIKKKSLNVARRVGIIIGTRQEGMFF